MTTTSASETTGDRAAVAAAATANHHHEHRDVGSAVQVEKRQQESTVVPIPSPTRTSDSDSTHGSEDRSVGQVTTTPDDVPVQVVSESPKVRPSRHSGHSEMGKSRSGLCYLPYKLCLLLSMVYSCLRLVVILVQNLYHVPTYLFFTWVFLYPIYFFRPSLFNWIENKLYSICLYTVGSWSWFANIQVIECGDDLSRIRESPTGVVYGSAGGNNNSADGTPVSSPESPTTKGRDHQLNHHNTVNHMKNQMSKEQHFRSSDHVSALIEIPVPVIDSRDPADGMKGQRALTSPMSPLHAGRCKLQRPMSLNSVTGSEVSSCQSKGRILLMANHQSTSDVPLMFQALVTKAKYVLLWVMDFQFKYTHFGVISGTHGDYFITPKTFVKNELTKHCLSNPDKDLIILFPEGGFRYKRLESSKSYAAKRGWPALHHLTWPRTGAFLDLTEGALDLTHIVDLTILYPNQETAISVLDIVFGRKPQQIYFHYRVFELTGDGVYGEKWLNERWIEKEALMKSFYENPDDFLRTKAGVLRPIQMSYWKILLNNVLMLIGFCVVYVVIKFLVSVFI